MATKNQERVFERYAKKVAKGGKVSIRSEMKGIYGKAYQHNAQRLTRSKGWEELKEKYLPDSLLLQRHTELLNKREIAYSYVNGVKEGELIDAPDTQAVSKGLDMAYKIKSRYVNDKSPNVNINIIQGVEINIRKDE